MATRDYSSIHSIKEFMINEIAPRFVDTENINLLNVGLFGYSTEVMANTTEDTFNSIAANITEIAPNTAQNPETLYNQAAMLDIDDVFAIPSEMGIIVFVNEKDINRYGVANNGRLLFTLDSDLTIDIEGKQYKLDYDVIISSKEYANDYIYTASYDFTFSNTISQLANPYIKTKRISLNGGKYLGLIVKVHQVNKFEHNENIINNDKINSPKVTFEFENQLAGFEVFYKAPESDKFVQMKKRMFGTVPLVEPFCFYRFKDNNMIEITFTLRDNYFQPAFNSEILVNYYTTRGEEGNNPLYKGTDIIVTPSSQNHEYNNSIVVYAVPQTESSKGKNMLGKEELRRKVIERNSTSGAFNVENDLQLYFSNYRNRDKTKVLFVKKRDDALERLFSAFSLLKDNIDDYYPTNTLNMNLNIEDFDITYEQTNKFILKAGHVFKYGDGIDTVKNIPGITVADDLSVVNEKFKYTNPYLISVSKSPSIVGFYLNSINENIPLEYNYVNGDSIVQFICNTLTIKRNALLGESDYIMQVNLIPTSDLIVPIVDVDGNDMGNLKVILAIEDGGIETSYIEFSLVDVNLKEGLYTFETKITTDDYMTFGQKMRVMNMKDIVSNEEEVALIPMTNCKVNIYALYLYPDMKLDHKFDSVIDYQPYSVTNVYITEEKHVDFILPLDIVRSQVKYEPRKIVNDYGDEEDSFSMKISFVPMIEAEAIKDYEQFTFFLNNIYDQYKYLLDAIDKVTNNYGIDLKFYNTYGRSKNFVVGEDGTILDQVNIKLKFKVALNIGAIEEDVVRDIKIYIKDYIEGINNNLKGYNSIYISKLSAELQNNFSDIRYLKFVGINDYDSSVQVIENRGVDINNLTKDERKDYVPEYLTVKLDDITIDVIR